MTARRSTRPYRKTKRARQEEETRLRITEAAVELHGTVGPAKSGVSDVARVAGVSRMTVYSHFPGEIDLFRGCSSHWLSQNPRPDPAQWAVTNHPAERLATALRSLYEWYRLKEGMLGNVMRDMPLLPSLTTVMQEQWAPWTDAIVETLSLGWSVAPGEAGELESSLRLAVDFGTWRTLTDAGLGDARAAGLMARMVATAIGSAVPRPAAK